MSKIVRIENGIVIEVFGEVPELHPSLMAQLRDDAPDTVEQGWLFNGSTYAAPVPPEPGPIALPPITARQIRLALIRAGLMAQVEAAIATLSDEDKVEWNYASQYVRGHPLIANMAAALGLTTQQVDSLWTQALAL